MEKSFNNSLKTVEKEELYRQVVEYSFETTIIHCNQKVLYINEAGANFLRASKNELIGANVVDVFTEQYREFIVGRIRKGSKDRSVGELIETSIYRTDGTIVDVELYCHPVIYGETKAIQSIIRDITPRREAESKLEQVMSEVATPIVPVYDGIAVIPLIGDLNECRTRELLEIIPRKLQDYNLDYIIIDVSGIYNIDEIVVNFIYKIDSIIKLLGISLVYTGLRPELARKSVEARLDVTSLDTMSNVKQALSRLVN
ncbi:PAS domain S-box protein [Aquibacillus saliphilus]|uniref:PAS domain S-box protein n=1 Tax=Aquibacillus saliphilus TaxID=1909422 RepID=UPI001CF044C2|nr:PAS domain S-box protein [Aquibacillus saliphilus]